MSEASNLAKTVYIDYTNYRGERAVRRVVPHRIEFNSNEYHREPQWLLYALDVDRQVWREFAMRDIHQWSIEPIAGSGQR